MRPHSGNPGRPKKEGEDRLIQFSIRMSPELKERIEAAAWDGRRSLSEEIALRVRASFTDADRGGVIFDGKPLDKATAERLIEALQAYTAKLP